jgi:predicted transcriptional regulator
MSQSLTDYFNALERLISDEPQVVPKGTKITNDSVALEAGRGKGSIKRSRSIFADLIVAIDSAAEAKAKASNPHKERMAKLRTSADDYRTKWEASIAREVCLLQELYELKQQLRKLTGRNVLPIRGE